MRDGLGKPVIVMWAFIVGKKRLFIAVRIFKDRRSTKRKLFLQISDLVFCFCASSKNLLSNLTLLSLTL